METVDVLTQEQIHPLVTQLVVGLKAPSYPSYLNGMKLQQKYPTCEADILWHMPYDQINLLMPSMCFLVHIRMRSSSGAG